MVTRALKSAIQIAKERIRNVKARYFVAVGARLSHGMTGRWKSKNIAFAAISFVSVTAIVLNLLLPALQARAASLTWSDDADFSMNKAGTCGAITSSNIVVSGAGYDDVTCAAASSDAAMTLKHGGILLSDVKQVANGYKFSLALKNDGTVWAWGDNTYGELGDGTTLNQADLRNTTQINENVPIQVKDPSGTGYLSDVKQIAAGNHHALALKSDGTVWSWGLNGQTWAPQAGAGWTSMGGGLLGDGTSAWHSIPIQVKNSSGSGYLTDVKQVAAGSYTSYALKNDGTAWAWGAGGGGALGNGSYAERLLPDQIKNPSGSGFMQNVKMIASTIDINEAAGGSSATQGSSVYILTDDGNVYASGSNNKGQLGNGSTNRTALPILVQLSSGVDLSGITYITGGNFSGFALATDGSVYAWGLNGNGQLGDGTTSDRYNPVKVMNTDGSGNLSDVQQVSSGSSHTTALLNDGTLLSWGLNSNGQLGDGTTTQSTLPVMVKAPNGTDNLDGIKYVSAAGTFVTAVTNSGTVYGWGMNDLGQAGYTEDLQTSYRTLPGQLLAAFTRQNMNGVKKVIAGANASFAIMNDGTVLAWGDNSSGQLGDGTTTSRSLPVYVKDPAGTGKLQNVVDLSSGGSDQGYFTLAVTSDGSVYAWGNNNSGQLGTGGVASRLLPTRVLGESGVGYLANIKQVSAGNFHSLALADDGTGWGWGSNGSGQLGDNSQTNRQTPSRIRDSSGNIFQNLKEVVAGGGTAGQYMSYSAGLDNDGNALAWGCGFIGQLGNGVGGSGSCTISKVPVQVFDPSGTGTLGNVKDIESSKGTGHWSSGHMIALMNDGTVFMWGDNQYLPTQVKDSAGTGYLSNVVQISGNRQISMARKADGTVWTWSVGGNPSQVQSPDGLGFLTGTTDISMGGDSVTGGYYVLAVGQGGDVLAWGTNTAGRLGDNSNINRALPVNVYQSIIFSGGYLPQGTAQGYVVDLGQTRKTKWYSVDWNTDALPANTSVDIVARTSNNGVTWSQWSTGSTQVAAGSTSGSSNLSALPFSRFIEIKVSLANTDYASTPTLNDFTLSMMDDHTTPPTNASGIAMKKSPAGDTVADGAWNNSLTPYFTWTAGEDETNGSGIGGYCLYLGQDNTADVTTTKGVLGTSPLDTDGKCQFAVSTNELNTADDDILPSALASSNTPYYLLVKAIDNAGNLYDGPAATFSFKNDTTPPKNVSFVTVPAQFIPTKDVTITWPTSGAQTASDDTSGLAGLQYKIGTDGEWQGLAHNGKQDTSDVIPLADGSYQTDVTHDYPLLSDGNNMLYFRTIDNAGNVSSTQISAVVKINSSAPSSPQNLIATPTTNTLNAFAFSWQAPDSFVGSASNITYCYTVNTLPTVNTCTYTSTGQTGVSSGPFATQPGDNTFYVVARDEAGNINYATAASVTFNANTSAPGIPLNIDVADVSVKSTANWKIAVSWEAPSDVGAGVANYRLYRSTSPTSGFAQIATTSGESFVDSKLNPVMYYYKVQACDSANNCGAETNTVSKLPTGRFTTPAELIGTPVVEASTRSATVRWVTARGSDSRVQFGTASGKYQATEAAKSDQVVTHSVELTGLEAGTTYYYRAKWTDEDGNIGTSTELTFTTLPAPTIKSVKVVGTTLDSAILQFTSKDATKVNVYYGKGESLGALKTVNTSLSESVYTLNLSDLDDGVTYSFRPDGVDVDGNSYTGNIYTFTTPPRPRISSLQFQPVEGEPTSTQKVTWVTNVPTTSQVSYGVTGSNGKDILDSKLTRDHSIVIRDLQDDSNYFLVATSRDKDGNQAVSDQQSFRTALDTRPPKISNIRSESSTKGNGGDARGQIVISWTTDEPATSQIFYGQNSNGNYPNSTTGNANLSTEHTVVISDLHTSTVYYLQPHSCDKAGNCSNGDEQSAIIGRPPNDALTIIIDALTKVFGL